MGSSKTWNYSGEAGEGWMHGSLSPPHTFMEKCLEISGLIQVSAAWRFRGKCSGSKVSFGVTALIPGLVLPFTV